MLATIKKGVTKLPFDQLSTKICSKEGCKVRIKQRLGKSNDLCYKHHCEREALRGHRQGDYGNPRKKRVIAGESVKAVSITVN